MKQPSKTQRSQTNWRQLAFVASVCVLMAIAGGYAYTTWIADSASENEGLVFVIPAGASENLEVPTIDTAIEIPTEIIFEPGENASVTIINEDSVANRAGPWVVGPGQKYSLQLDEPGEYQFDCAVDPAESVTIIVKEP